MTKSLLATFLFTVSLFMLNVAVADQQPPLHKTAIGGYDAVAYFTLNDAIQGSEAYQLIWDNKTWWFLSARHRDLFAENPEQYAPQFGGACANGLSDGHSIAADPEFWRIIKGKLYLYFTDYGRDQWSGRVPSLIESANKTYLKHQGE